MTQMYSPFLFFTGINICLFSLALKAQPFVFSPAEGLPVSFPGGTLEHAWDGGLNSPQFSAIDLNGDGLSDLFVFDRESGSRLLYINESDSTGMRYRLARNELAALPEMKNWALLRDFNGDGKPDLFTWAPEGVQCYQNVSINGTLSFQPYGGPLRSRYGIFPANLFVSLADLPDLYDVDGDGDLDLLTMNILGGCVEWHRNRSRELYGHSDSLIFELATGSWGRFREYGTLASIQLQDSCAGAAGVPELKPRHAGTTLLVADLSGNGLPDVVIGDADTPELAYLQNGGTLLQAAMESLHTDFPGTHSGTIPVFLPEFPGSFLVPVGTEPSPALIAAPNAFSNYEDRAGVWLYTRSAQQPPQFQFRSTNFLQGEMIDVGTGAFPTLANLSNAAIPDLIIGSYSDFSANPRLWHFSPRMQNGNWSYELTNSDLGSTSVLPGEGRYPAFADLNGDGLSDLLFARANGDFFWIPNTGTATTPQFVPQNRIPLQLQAGAEPVPVLFDVDRDGLYDLIVGTLAGTLSWFKNSGSSTQPQFDPQPTATNWGQVNVATSVAPQGRACPAIFGSPEQPLLLVGNAEGRLFQFGNLYAAPGVPAQQFTQWSNLRPIGIRGSDFAPVLFDFTGNGIPTLLVGNRSGGLFWLEATPSAVNLSHYQTGGIHFFPNPTAGRICLTDAQLTVMQWKLSTLTGRSLVPVIEGNCINLNGLPSGMYQVCIQTTEGYRCEKILFSPVD